MQDLKISIIQSEIIWENPDKNINHFNKKIDEIIEETDLIILPEVFSTGFPVDPNNFAETLNGKTISWLKQKASEKNCVITGSILIEENKKFYNCLIWMPADGKFKMYNKRHVFHLGEESDLISPGKEKLIVELKGWKICPMICFDLRFPVWSKNCFINNTFEYDLLVYVANWPAQRSYPWKQLLISRAIENLSYLVGVNRIGTDGEKNNYSGDSAVINPAGKIISNINPGKEQTETIKLSYKNLNQFRNNFNVGYDWDNFEIND